MLAGRLVGTAAYGWSGEHADLRIHLADSASIERVAGWQNRCFRQGAMDRTRANLSISAAVSLSTALVFFSRTALADPPKLAPNLYRKGNLRVSVACAEDPLVEPTDGLRVSLDGDPPLEPLSVNSITNLALDSDDNEVTLSLVTDIGFLAPPGQHSLTIEAPGCRSLVRDVRTSDVYAERVRGRLAVDNPMLRGPVGAPNGIGVLLGGISLTVPHAIESGTASSLGNSSAYTATGGPLPGLLLSSSIERRFVVLALDISFQWGSLQGSLQNSSTSFQENLISTAFTGRLGLRLPLQYVVLAGGSGIGAALWFQSPSSGGAAAPTVDVSPGSGPALWYVPLWGSVTLKPFCDWGVQGLLSYDVDPSNSSANTFGIGAGLLWQPSASCSQPPGVAAVP